VITLLGSDSQNAFRLKGLLVMNGSTISHTHFSEAAVVCLAPLLVVLIVAVALGKYRARDRHQGAADPVRKPRREVSDLLPFSSRYACSRMYFLSFSGMTRVLATSVHRRSFDLFCIPIPLGKLRPRTPELLGTELYLSLSMESTNVRRPRITARLRLPMVM
jgi:hypothetical protein